MCNTEGTAKLVSANRVSYAISDAVSYPWYINSYLRPCFHYLAGPFSYLNQDQSPVLLSADRHIRNHLCLKNSKSKEMRWSHSSATPQRCHLIFPASAKKFPVELEMNLVLPGLMNRSFLYTDLHMYIYSVFWEQISEHVFGLKKVSFIHTVQVALPSRFVRENWEKTLIFSTS